MIKKIITALLLVDIVFFAASYFINRNASSQFTTSEEILMEFRKTPNIKAAEVVSSLHTEMLPWTKEVKKNLALMQICKKEETVLELQTISTEIALNRITAYLLTRIQDGSLSNREAVVFAFSGTFTSWLFDVNEAAFISTVEEFMQKTYGSLSEEACNKEEEKTKLFIDEMKFVTH